MTGMEPKPTPFIKLSRRKQRDAFIRWRWRILKDTPIYGGQFTSQLILDDTDCILSGWFDFTFLGLDGRTVWNSCILTAAVAYLDASEFSPSKKGEIHEQFQIDPSYPREVGLNIIVDEPSINRAVIENAIRRFRELGEVGWTNPVPVSKDRLLITREGGYE